MKRFGPVGSGACGFLAPFEGINLDFDICEINLFISNREQDISSIPKEWSARVLLYNVVGLLRMGAYILYIIVVTIILSITALFISLRLFGPVNVVAPLFVEYSVEIVPYGAQHLMHLNWQRAAVDFESLWHSAVYTSNFALESLTDWKQEVIN